MKTPAFGNISELARVLRMDYSRLNPAAPKDIAAMMADSGSSATVHLYPAMLGRRKESCLFSMQLWSYHQIYLCHYNGKIHYSVGHGSSSGARQRHNELIDLFLKSPELQKKVLSAVIVSFKGSIAAYYFHEHYSYAAHDIGSNWDSGIAESLKQSGLPYSSRVFGRDSRFRVAFADSGREILVYDALREDICQREFEKRLRARQRV